MIASSGRSVDVVLADVVIPEVTGPKLVERLRDECDALRFVFMSGHEPEHVLEEEWRRSGSDLFLQKPFSTEDLYAKLDEVMVG